MMEPAAKNFKHCADDSNFRSVHFFLNSLNLLIKISYRNVIGKNENKCAFLLHICQDAFIEVLRYANRRRLIKFERVSRGFHQMVENFFRERPFIRKDLDLKPGFVFLYFLIKIHKNFANGQSQIAAKNWKIFSISNNINWSIASGYSYRGVFKGPGQRGILGQLSASTEGVILFHFVHVSDFHGVSNGVRPYLHRKKFTARGSPSAFRLSLSPFPYSYT